jgi:hypothetical protein
VSWKNPYRNKARAHHRYNIKDAVDYFRDEELEPVHVTDPCPHCHKEGLEFEGVEVDERIELRIGGYRMALYANCYSYCVIFAPVAAKNNRSKMGLLARRKRTPEEIEENKKYLEMLRAWYEKNGWKYA